MSKRVRYLLVLVFYSRRLYTFNALTLKNMEPKVNLLKDPAYQKLQEFYNLNSEKINIQQLFQQDPDRFNKFRFVLNLIILFYFSSYYYKLS